jgi:hypothetical protein
MENLKLTHLRYPAWELLKMVICGLYIHSVWSPLLYRVSHEEGSIFWEAIISAILSKKMYTYMCPIPNGFRDRASKEEDYAAVAPVKSLPFHQ